MTIDKRINFRGGGMDMGNESNEEQSASMGNTTSGSTSSGKGGSKGNLGGGGGGQESDYRQYSPPTAPTYNSSNIDQKPVTGNDYRRSQNEFINNFNQNEASRFEPTFFNRNYNPIALDQFGSSNQPRNYGNAAMGGILSLINPALGRIYSGYNFLKDKVPQFNLNQNVNQDVNQELEDNTYYQKLIAQRDKLEALKNKANELTGIESVQTVGSDFPLNIQEIQGLINNSQTEGATGLTFQEIQSLIDNSRNNLG